MDIVWLLVCLITLGCGHKKTDSKSTVNGLDQIKDKYSIYNPLAAEFASRHEGFITDGCDSLLFTGLYSSLADNSTPLGAARDADGKWHRRPIDMPECYPGDSGSSISRDMLIGLIWGLYKTKNLGFANDLASYGEAHNWQMGDGDVSAVTMTPDLISTLYLVIENIGGAKAGSKGDFPVALDSSLTGFRAHLEILHVLLRADMVGATDGQIKMMKSEADRQPQNALFQAAYHKFADGDQSAAIAALMDESQWPADKPPTTSNHCEFWLWQRDLGSDWEPCAPEARHSGADWLFAAKLLMN